MQSIPLIGHETVDSLRGLQMMVDSIDDSNQKLTYIRKALRILPTTDLLGREGYVDSVLVLAKHPEKPPKERIRMDSGLKFLGHITSCNYVQRQEELIDYLTLDFTETEIIGDSPIETASLESHILHVPVLAINRLALAG